MGAPLFRIASGIDFIGLPPELRGELHEFAARWIVPRKTFRQPQTDFGLVPEIYRVHRTIPAHATTTSDGAEVKPRRASRRDGDHRLSGSTVTSLGVRTRATVVPRPSDRKLCVNRGMVAVAVLFRGCREAASERSRWLFRIGWSVSLSSQALPALLRLLSWQGRQAKSNADAAAKSLKGAILIFKTGQQTRKQAITKFRTRTYCEPRTNRVHSFDCQLSQASGGGRTFRALRIPVIRSARNECSTSPRRRIVHG